MLALQKLKFNEKGIELCLTFKGYSIGKISKYIVLYFDIFPKSEKCLEYKISFLPVRFLSNLTIRCYKTFLLVTPYSPPPLPTPQCPVTKLIKEIISRSNFILKLKGKEKFPSLAPVISHIAPSALMVKTRIPAK